MQLKTAETDIKQVLILITIGAKGNIQGIRRTSLGRQGRFPWGIDI